MKQKVITLFVALLLNISHAEALWDIFLNKHEKAIDNIILKALDKPDCKWFRAKGPSNGDYSSRSLYILDKEAWNEDRSVVFGFEEFYLEKHPSSFNLSDLNEINQKSYNQKSETRVIKNSEGELFLRRFYVTGDIILEEENSSCMEIQCFVCERKRLKNSKDRNNLYGPEIIPEIPVDYGLCYTVDAGDKKFRQYSFQFLNKKPSEDEKNQIIEFFKSLEAQIQSVPS